MKKLILSVLMVSMSCFAVAAEVGTVPSNEISATAGGAAVGGAAPAGVAAGDTRPDAGTIAAVVALVIGLAAIGGSSSTTSH